VRTFDHVVIGKGLVGTATAKYLTKSSGSVLIIGPDEPTDFSSATMFASHYDQARAQRIINFTPMWTQLSIDSVNAYPELEAESGITFHNGAGCIYLAESKDEYLASVPAQAKQFNLPYQVLENASDVAKLAPEFVFDRDVQGIYEPGPAGTINPRALVQAQLAVFEKSGGSVLRDVATDVSRNDSGWLITTATGEQISATNVVVAGGSFSNYHNLLPVTLDILVKSEVVILAQVSAEQAGALAKLPSLLYEIHEPDFDGIYLMRPVQYPDGNWYLKMGMNQRIDLFTNSLTELNAWFQGQAHSQYLPILQREIEKLFPTINFLSFQTKPCVISRTTTLNPYIDVIEPGLFVATGCNGYSAMTSDGQGKVAANLVLTGQYPAGYQASDFAVDTK
jgi:sarcosine oxidase